MDVPTFIAKWSAASLKERSAAQSHFNDLCELLGQPKPTDVDPDGRFFTFEKGAGKAGGGDGWADVWYRGHFGWEYKGKHANLDKAYEQLLRYKDDLENPPLLIVCDLDTFVIHTNFTNTVKRTHRFALADLAEPATLTLLRLAFTEPNALKPGTTTAAITEEAAGHFGRLALGLRERGVTSHAAAHFLMQLLFCLFAEDVGLLPGRLFSELVAFGVRHPDAFPQQCGELLSVMATGGYVSFKDIPYFNGGLFREAQAYALTRDELRTLHEAARLDWSAVEPAIFGTLFERSLDPDKRAQLGAHYTGRADIERVVEPVLMAPLRRRWAAVRREADALKAAWDEAATPRTRDNRRAAFAAKLSRFQHELSTVRVLDPACGSGNFLYVALEKLLNLEKEVLLYGATNGLPMGFPTVKPSQLAGLEVNAYARELAQVVIWIGYLQWMIGNGYSGLNPPILEPLETIRLQDALLDRTDPARPTEACWPAADYIIGNPPFLGDKKLRTGLGDAHVEDLFAVYRGRVPGGADLCCYFFEKARAQIAAGCAKRAGLLATSSIRGGANRAVLTRIKATGDIFMAWDDEPWVLDGAALRISIVGFDDGTEPTRALDDVPVAKINADLTASVDITAAGRLAENRGIAFIGDTKKAPFDIPGDVARAMLALPLNPNGRPNADVIRPWANGLDVTRRPQDRWIIDFGVDMPLDAAMLYEAPFEYVRAHVLPLRVNHREAIQTSRWWLHARPSPDMRRALAGLTRFVATPTLAKHRLFVWLPCDVLPDHQLYVFARQDDYFFGVLHSRAHEVWSLRMGTSLEDRPRYTPTTCFETFPLPWPPGQEPWRDPRLHAIAEAARALDDVRTRWLNPPDADGATLKQRTLTKLYNERSAWLARAHAALDRAVWTAYGWADPAPAAVEDDTILGRLLALNRERGGAVL